MLQKCMYLVGIIAVAATSKWLLEAAILADKRLATPQKEKYVHQVKIELMHLEWKAPRNSQRPAIPTSARSSRLKAMGKPESCREDTRTLELAPF